MPEIEDVTPAEATVILNLDLGKVTNRRRIDSDTDAVDTEIDREMLHIGIDLFDAKELRDCQNFQARLKNGIKHYCVPSFFRGGMYMVKMEAIEIVDKMIYDAIEEFRPLVEAFANVVDQRRDESKERLGPAFDASAYPNREQVLGAYRIDHRWLTMGTPDSLKKISLEFFNREKAKAEKTLQRATEGITALLAAEVKELGDHLVERLTWDESDPQAKPKQIRKSAVENIRAFLETFSLRNIGTSEELEEQIAKIDKLLTDVDAKDLRMNAKLREDVKKGFKEVSKSLDIIITEKPKRYMGGDE